MEHELRALMHVLRHNLATIGSPLIGLTPAQNSCFDHYSYLAEHLISYTDPIGTTFLTPCKDPKHKVHGTNVFENEFKHHFMRDRKVPTQNDFNDDDHDVLDLLVESRKILEQKKTL